MARRLLITVLALALAATLAACGEQSIDLPGEPTANEQKGAEIFNDKCSGCHTLEVTGSQGSAVNVRDRERVDGPNFNTRPEDVESILYAIRNGGFSGAIMPENIVVGREAQQVAEFLAKYAGQDAAKPVTPTQQQPGDG
jgi:mono/diheme cytochrome c family protein